MPPVVNFLIAVGSFITAGAAVGATAAVIGTVVVASAVFAASRLMGKIDMGVVDTDRARQTTVRSTIEPRKLVYGETMISGVVSFAQVDGANNKNLHQVIAIAGHKLTSIDKIFFDDYSIDLSTQVNGSGDVTSGKFAKKTNEDGTLETMVHIETRDGSTTQTAYSDLVTAFAGTGLNAGKGYETTHRGDGVASIYTRWTIHEGTRETWDEVGGIQNIKAVVKGKAVYDPRLDVAAGNDAGDNPTTAAYVKYSDGATTATHQRDLQGQNPALMLADYLMDSSFGLGIPASKIDWPAVITAADACDFLVPIPTSQTQKRFFGSGVIFGSDNHRKSISKILSGMNGDLIYSQGKYIIKAGIHEASSLAFTEDDLAGDFTVKTSIPRADRFNTIKGMFIDPDSNYKMTEFSPRSVSGAVARDNGEVLEEEIKLTFTSDRYVAQRIAIKKVNQSFLQTTLSLPVNLKGMKVAVGDRITLALNDFATIDADWNPNKEFKVIGWSFSESGNGAIDLSLIEDDSARYADPAEGEYNQISNTGVITSSLADVPLPTNFTATAGYNSVNLAWTNPTNIGAWEQIWIYVSDTTTPPATPIEKFRGTAFTHQIAGGTAKYYWIQAVKYPLGSTPASGSTNTSKSALVPFGSPTAVTALKIANAVMADDSINTAQIISDAVGSDQIATTLQSDNFSVPNQTGWQISKNGDTTFNNTVVRGNISASTGSIGGITVDADSIHVGTGTFNNANTAFYADDAGQFSLKDKLSWDGSALSVSGAITATSGTFTGTVNASAGAFTGDVSTDSKFVAGSGATSATMDGGDTNFKFYAGAAAAGDSPFKVDADGAVTTDRIVITRPGDPSAVIFDSAQDGLVGVGLSSLSLDSDNAVAQVADELTSNTDYARLILSANAQTLTIKVLFPLGYAPFAISSAEDFPDSITLTLQITSVTNGTPGTFNNIAGGSKTFTRRVYSSGAPSDDDYYSVYDSGTGWYKKGKDAIDGQFNLAMTYSGITTAGDKAIRVQVSYVAGSGATNANPSSSSKRTLYFNSSTQYFTINDSDIIRDQAAGSLVTGDVILSAPSGARSIAWRDSDTQDENWSIETETHYDPNTDSALFFKYDNGSTAPIAFVPGGNILTAGDFITTSGAIAATTASIGGGYGSTGLSIAADGNLSTDGNVVIGGDLTVSGTTTTVNTDNLTVKDPNITLNYATGDSSSTANNAGITIQDAVDANTNATILWKTATDTFEFSHPVTWPGGSSANANTAYTYSQVGHLPLAGGTLTGAVSFNSATHWNVSSADVANQRADARDEATNFSRLHWYGESDSGATSNFRHAWYDGTSYINVTAASSTVTFGGGLAATTGSFSSDVTVTGDVETKIIDQYEEFAVGNGDRTVEYFSKVLATYSEDGVSNTYIILTTSVPQSSSSMGGFQLSFWDNYGTSTAGDVVDIYGYWNPESNGGFVGFRYNSKNPNFEPTIQVGADSNGNTVFILSNFGTSGYAQLVAKDLWLGYAANNISRSSGQGWSFSTSNSITAYSNLDTLTRNGVTSAQITNLNTAYNYSQVGHLPLAGGTLTGDLSGTTVNSYSAIGASDNVRTGLAHYDTTAMSAGVGGQLVLNYKYLTSGGYTAGAILKTYKENGTSNSYGSGLKFQVRNHGADLSTKMTLDPSGNLSVTGSLSNNNEINFGNSRLFSSISANTGGGNYELYIQPDANNTHQWRIIAGGTNTGYSTGDGGLGFFYQAAGTGNSNYNLILKADGTSDFGFDVYANKHLHIGKNGGWLQFYDDGGVGSTVSKGNLYFDAPTKEFRFYSAVLSSGAAESTATLKRYSGSAYESIYDTGSGVPWADINAGVRTNFTIGFKPATSNYAGLLFEDENSANAGYLLVRANSDVAPTYKANGIHLIADAGYLSLISRTTSNTGVRILSGAVPDERMVFKSDGYIDQPVATWQRTYHQQHEYASGHTANDVHTHWGVLAAGSHNGVPSTYTIIQTNVSQDAYRMGGFTLLVMDNYNDPSQRERIDLAGYWNPESNGGFLGWGYTTTNPALRPTIQVMRNTSTGKVAFAYTHSSGSYPVIVACDLWLGYVNSIEDDGRDWSMIGASNLNAYTNIDTVNCSGGNGNYQATDGHLFISKANGSMLSHGSFSDAIGYNASYGTYIGANSRYVYSGLSTHPIFYDGTNAHNILHNGGQIANTYNGDHTFTTTTSSAGIKVTNNQTGGPALKIHNTATNGTDWWLISNGSSNTEGAGKLQLYSNNNSFTCATFGETATDITQLNTQTRVTATGTPPSFTTTTSGAVTPLLLANSNGQGAHTLVVNQTQTSHWAQVISTQGYGLKIDTHASNAAYLLLETKAGDVSQFKVRGDGVTFCKSAFHLGDSATFGTLQIKANSSSGGTIDAFAPNGSYVHSDVRDNGTWSMAHKYTYKDGSGYGNYTENWWDGNSYHQLGSMSNAIRTNSDFVASGNITAYGTYSDRRLKENIRPFENARDLISGINVHRFNYIGKDDDLIGVIAQEVEETLPQLVYELIDTDSDEVRKAVRYDHLSAVLLKAVKEQDEEIKELKEMVKKLMEKIQ